MNIGTKLFGGLNEISPEDILEQDCQLGLNTLTDKKIGSLGLKYGNLPHPYAVGTAGQWLKSLHNYQDNTLLAEYNNASGIAELYYWRDTDTQWTKITSHTWNGFYKLRSCMHLDKLYLVNGFNRMRYWKNKAITECEADVTGYAIPIAKYIALHDERMFLAGGGDRPYGIYFSNLNDPSVVTKQLVNPYQVKAWGNINVIYLDNKELITGLIVYRGMLVVSQWRNLWILEGISPATFRKIEVESATQKNIGCVCGDTMVVKEGMLYGIDKQCLWQSDGNTVRDISTLKINPTFVSLATKIPREMIAKTTDVDDWDASTLNNITTRDNYGMAELINVHRAGMKETALANETPVETGTNEKWYAYWNKWIQEGGTSEANVRGWIYPNRLDDNDMDTYSSARVDDGEQNEDYDTNDVIEFGYIWGLGLGITKEKFPAREQVLCENGGYPQKWILKARFQNICKGTNIYLSVRSADGGWNVFQILPAGWANSNTPLTGLLDLTGAGEIFGLKLWFRCDAGLGTAVARVYCLVPYTDVASAGAGTGTGLELNTRLTNMKLLRANMWRPQKLVWHGIVAAPSVLCNAYKTEYPTVAGAYVGWVWEDSYKIKLVFMKFKINADVGAARLEYKSAANVWTLGLNLSAYMDGQAHEVEMDLNRVAKGLRIKGETFSATSVFEVFAIYIREGTITSPTIPLGNISDAVFNTGFNTQALDIESWDGSGNAVPTFIIKGADTEAGLPSGWTPNGNIKAITNGQSLKNVGLTAYKWVQWQATLKSYEGGGYVLAYPQIKWINIEAWLGGALYNQPHSIRFEERLLWAFPDKDIKSYMLIYDRAGNFQKHEDKGHITKFCVFDEVLYGSKSNNELVYYDANTITDCGETITLTWQTKNCYGTDIMSQVEAIKYFITIKNNGAEATLTLTENAGGSSYTITALANQEQIYSGWFPTGIIFNKNSFTMSFNKDLEILQFAIELRELKPKEF